MRRKLLVTVFVPLILALVLANPTATAQYASSQEIYESAIMALGHGHVNFATNFLNTLLEDHPDSEYAASAAATIAGIHLGRFKANTLLLNVLREGKKQATGDVKSNYESAIENIERKKESNLEALADSYNTYVEKYGETSVTLELSFLDIGKDVGPLREDLDKLSRGVWIPLLIAPFDRVRLLYTYRDLLVITGVDFSEKRLKEWVGAGHVERALSKESFYYAVGSAFFEEDKSKPAVDALRRVIRLTRHQPYSELRKKAVDLLEEMGVSPEEDEGEDEGLFSPPEEEPPPDGEGISVLFDETRLFRRPTGEVSGQIADTSWYGYSDLAASLRAEGFVVDSLEEKPITEEKLFQYDVFAILTTDHNQPYSYLEAVFIASFVESGGGLLICESTWAGPQPRDYTVGALAYLFGVGFIGNGQIIDPKSNREEGVVVVRETARGPIMEGVSEVTMVEAAYIEPTGGSRVIGVSSKDSWFDDSSLPKTGVKEEDEISGPLPVASTLKPGNGRVIFLADGMLFTNGWLNVDDNATFALNSFSWLAEGASGSGE